MPTDPVPECAVVPGRLRSLLDGRLDEAEQADLSSHLEACGRCREALDAMAGGSAFLVDARAYLGPEATAGHGVSTGGFPRPDGCPIEPGSLGFLTPPDDPSHLGRLGPYEVVGGIGRGGMGLVLKALDPSLGRFVAIKVMAPELATSATARRRFAREARAAAAIVHEHVVAIHAVDAAGPIPYLVMGLVAGHSLQDRIDATGPLAVEEVVRIGMQTASALASAHAVGLIHRDIKPSNILLEGGVERVKVTDFGLARAVDDASLTRSGVVAGTPQYMSPEQARGEPVDHRTDLFSLGSVLYALCTGRPPFRADSTMAVLRRVSDDTPRPILELNPDVPGWLAAIVDRLHAKAPLDRFDSADDVVEILSRGLAHLREPTLIPAPHLSGTNPMTPRPRPTRRRLAIAAGLMILVFGGLGAAEASGLTDLATVLRIKTSKGTIVLDVSDPKVKVKLDGDEVVLSGPGLPEIRVAPGEHWVEATRDGKPIARERVEIQRGEAKAVSIGFEPEQRGDGSDDLASIRQAVERVAREPANFDERLRTAAQRQALLVQAAELDLEQARAGLDRSRILHDAGAIAVSEREGARTAVRQAERSRSSVIAGSKPGEPALADKAPTTITDVADARLKADLAAILAQRQVISKVEAEEARFDLRRAELAAKLLGLGKPSTAVAEPADSPEVALKVATHAKALHRLREALVMKQAGGVSEATVQAAQIEVKMADLDVDLARARSNRSGPDDSEVARAEATVLRAADRLKYSESMRKHGFVSEAQVESTRLELKKAKSERDAARAKLAGPTHPHPDPPKPPVRPAGPDTPVAPDPAEAEPPSRGKLKP